MSVCAFHKNIAAPENALRLINSEVEFGDPSKAPDPAKPQLEKLTVLHVFETKASDYKIVEGTQKRVDEKWFHLCLVQQEFGCIALVWIRVGNLRKELNAMKKRRPAEERFKVRNILEERLTDSGLWECLVQWAHPLEEIEKEEDGKDEKDEKDEKSEVMEKLDESLLPEVMSPDEKKAEKHKWQRSWEEKWWLVMEDCEKFVKKRGQTPGGNTLRGSASVLLALDGSDDCDDAVAFAELVRAGLAEGFSLLEQPFDISRDSKHKAPQHDSAVWWLHSEFTTKPFEINNEELDFLQIVDRMPLPQRALVIVGCASDAVPREQYQQIADRFKITIFYNNSAGQETVVPNPALEMAARVLTNQTTPEVVTDCGRFVAARPSVPAPAVGPPPDVVMSDAPKSQTTTTTNKRKRKTCEPWQCIYKSKGLETRRLTEFAAVFGKKRYRCVNCGDEAWT